MMLLWSTNVQQFLDSEQNQNAYYAMLTKSTLYIWAKKNMS